MTEWPEKKKVDVAAHEKQSVARGIFKKCNGCDETLEAEVFARNFEVCPHCGMHHRLSPARFRQLLLDDGELTTWDDHLEPEDPLSFSDGKSYPERVQVAQSKTGEKEGIEIGLASIEGIPIAYGAFRFAFMGGSMGSVVGEKIARLFERGAEERLPVVLLSSSGGARMQEGILSLMQMAKTVAARERLRDAGVPFFSVLLDPTTGGVAASFALLGDLNLAEPKALIGFAGPRVIETTIRQKLPEGFQRAEFLLDHGMVDQIVPRLELRARLARFLGHFAPLVPPAHSNRPFSAPT